MSLYDGRPDFFQALMAELARDDARIPDGREHEAPRKGKAKLHCGRSEPMIKKIDHLPAHYYCVLLIGHHGDHQFEDIIEYDPQTYSSEQPLRFRLKHFIHVH